MRNLLAAMLALALYAQAQTPSGGGQPGWDKLKGPQDAWVYVVVGAYDAIGPRLEKAAVKLGPEAVADIKEIPTQIREGIGDSHGIARDAIDLSRPFAFAVYNPLAGQPPAAILPVKGELANDAKASNGYIVACDNEILAERLSSALKAAGAGAIAAPAGAVSVYIDVGTIFQLFGPFVQMQLASGMGGFGDPAGVDRQAAMAGMDLLFNLLGQIKHVLLDLDVNDQGLLVAQDTVVKEGTELAQLFGGQGGGTTIGGILPARAIVLNGKLKGLVPFVLKLADRYLAKACASPADAKTLRDAFAKYAGGAGEDFAMSMDFSPEGLVTDQINAFTGTFDDLRASYQAFASEKASALTSGAKFALQENVRQSGGVAVHKFTSTIDASALDSQAGAQVKKLLGGGLQGEVALANGKLITCSGGKDYSQRLDALIAASKNAGGAPGTHPVAFRCDLVRLLSNLAAAAGAGAETPASAPPISGTVAFAGPSAKSNVVIPIEAIAKVKEFVEQAFGVGGMGGAFAPTSDDEDNEDTEDDEDDGQ